MTPSDGVTIFTIGHGDASFGDLERRMMRHRIQAIVDVRSIPYSKHAPDFAKAELEAITEVARWSGSSRNEQSCRFIALRDRDLIGRIAEMALPQTRGLRSATAAVAIVEPDEPERADSRSFDDGRAAERMLIAAHMLGLGGGISRVRPDVRAGINEALRLPSNRSVRTIVAFGHPTEDALKPQSAPGRARLPREEVIYEECWPDPPLKD